MPTDEFTHFLTRLVFFGLSLLITNAASAQRVSNDSQLFDRLAEMDSLLFERGFNQCDTTILERIVSDDLEFYHDQGGVQDKLLFLQAVKQNICSSPDRKPIRKLVRESVDVYPLHSNGGLYGAIQSGMHEFYIRELGKDLYMTSVAQFTHLWLLEKGEWMLSGVLSYDHQQPPAYYGPQFDAAYAEPLFTHDEEILTLLRRHDIPSVGIGYLRNGALQQIRVFGEASEGRPARFDTIYKVASLAKPITAMVTLKLVDAGLWNLDEPVSRYYVDHDVRDSRWLQGLTTRHILSHRSGFPNWRYLTDGGDLTFEFEPGSRFQYSGEGFEYLRNALESKLGTTLSALASEYLFEPLSMTNTSFTWHEGIDEADYAGEHDENGKPLMQPKHFEANAAANLLTTVEDYGRFMAHIFSGAGLSEELYSEFIRPHAEQKPGLSWGLGVQVLDDLQDDEFALQHTGGDYGVKAIAVMLPESGRGLLILSNSENGMVLWRKLIEEYLAEIGEEIVRRNLQ